MVQRDVIADLRIFTDDHGDLLVNAQAQADADTGTDIDDCRYLRRARKNLRRETPVVPAHAVHQHRVNAR